MFTGNQEPCQYYELAELGLLQYPGKQGVLNWKFGFQLKIFLKITYIFSVLTEDHPDLFNVQSLLNGSNKIDKSEFCFLKPIFQNVSKPSIRYWNGQREHQTEPFPHMHTGTYEIGVKVRLKAKIISYSLFKMIPQFSSPFSASRQTPLRNSGKIIGVRGSSLLWKVKNTVSGPGVPGTTEGIPC